MMSGPIPPSAPSRMIPSLSIQKWTGSASASQASGRSRRCPARAGTWRPSCSANAATVPSSSLTSIARIDQPVVAVAGREAVHQRELVEAWRAVRAHEVDPDRLALAASRGRSSRRRPGARRAPAPARRCGTARRRARRRRAADGRRHRRSGEASADRGRRRARLGETGRLRGRRGRGAGLGGEGEDPPDDQRRGGDAGHQAGDDRQTWPHVARRVPVRAAGGVSHGARATMPLRWPARPSVRARVLPALLTALGVTLLAAGLLTYTVPVTAEPLADHQPGRERRRRATPAPLITLPPLGPRSRRPPRRRADRTASPRASGSRPSTSTCRWSAARRRRTTRLRRRPCPGRRARAAGPGPRDLPVRARPDGHVPAAADRIEGQNGNDARDGRRGLDERRPAASCTRSPRSAATCRQDGPRRPARAPRPRSSGSRPRRARQGHRPASSRSSPSRSSQEAADHAAAHPKATSGRLRRRPAGTARSSRSGAGRRAAPGGERPSPRRPPRSRRPRCPASAGPASLMPKMPAIAPIPARMTVTPVSRFMITDRLLLTCRQVDVERRGRELAVVVELVGQPDHVVVDVAEVDDLVGVDERHVAVRQLVEDLADRADRRGAPR